MLKVHEDESEVVQIKNSLLCLFFGYNLVRWAGATRWMVLRASWNGCSVGMIMTSGRSVFQALTTLG